MAIEFGKDSNEKSGPSNQTSSDNSSMTAIHIFWIVICIALIVSLYLAYLEIVTTRSFLDYLLPRVNVTQIGDTTEITKIVPEKVHAPFVPRFVLIWGFIGAATYVLKVTTKYLSKEVGFDKRLIPDHIVRLFLGTTFAIIVYFILSTGGFFGLTIDVTKLSNLNLVQYAYAVIAFIAGYSVRHIIHVLSSIANSIFMIQTDSEKKAQKT